MSRLIENFDFDGHFLHVLGPGEREIVERLNFDVVLDNFLDDGDHEMVALFLDVAADTLAEFVESNGSFARVDFVDKRGCRQGQTQTGTEEDQPVRINGNLHLCFLA